MGPGLGITLPTAADLPDPRARFACNPQLSGHGDRHDTNLREMAARGLRPVGRLDAAEGTRLRFSPGLRETLAFADTFFRDRFQGKIDTFVERAGLDVPTDEVSQFDHEPDEIAELDLATEGISTVIWTSGYRPGFGWVKLPVLDELGLPRQTGGRTDVPGLSFIGTPWLVDQGSANLVGLERDATALVEAAF
jgi:putative flavoprotein involved in K+ transport